MVFFLRWGFLEPDVLLQVSRQFGKAHFTQGACARFESNRQANWDAARDAAAVKQPRKPKCLEVAPCTDV